jgi:transcriptional regulator with XRE-family HTH domain
MARKRIREAVPVGAKIRATREGRGMTGAALAEAAGIHPTSLSFIERGRQWPSLPQVAAIAKALGVSPEKIGFPGRAA